MFRRQRGVCFTFLGVSVKRGVGVGVYLFRILF